MIVLPVPWYLSILLSIEFHRLQYGIDTLACQMTPRYSSTRCTTAKTKKQKPQSTIHTIHTAIYSTCYRVSDDNSDPDGRSNQPMFSHDYRYEYPAPVHSRFMIHCKSTAEVWGQRVAHIGLERARLGREQGHEHPAAACGGQRWRARMS